jgi:hypothetical protein
MKKRIFVVVVLLLALVNIASAATIWWSGPGQSGGPPWGYDPAPSQDWSDAANWITWPPPSYTPTHVVPTAADRVELNTTGYTTQVYTGTDAVCSNMSVGYSGSHTLIVSGGTLTVGGFTEIGGGIGDEGVMNVQGGVTSIGGNFAIGGPGLPQWSWPGGNGTLNMSNGSIGVTGALQIGINAGTGHVTIDGGIITAASLAMAANGLLTVSDDGMVVLPGDQTVLVGGYISSGWISGQANYMTSGEYVGNTLITIPEPVTLFLMGVGGLMISRRRKG